MLMARERGEWLGPTGDQNEEKESVFGDGIPWRVRIIPEGQRRGGFGQEEMKWGINCRNVLLLCGGFCFERKIY